MLTLSQRLHIAQLLYIVSGEDEAVQVRQIFM